MTNESMHAGHRDRVRERIEKGGFACLSDIEMLEYILYFSIPRADTNPLAHKLLNHFGSFPRVIEASKDELMTVDGIGEKSARLIASFLPVFRHYHLSCIHIEKGVLNDSAKTIRYFQNVMLGNQIEHTYALFLNQSRKVIKCVPFSNGTYNQTALFADQVIKQAITLNARYVVVAHNHTAGSVFPSQADFAVATELFNGLRIVRKNLADFIIVDHFEAFSFAENGIITDHKVVDGYYISKKTTQEKTAPTARVVQDGDEF